MIGRIKYPYVFLIYWMIYWIIFAPLSNALEMTTQWHIPKKEKVKSIQTVSKPLKLQPEKTIQIFESQKKTFEPKIEISAFARMQMNLIQAKILARKGRYPEAMKIYEYLIEKYPESLDIRADYADVLLEYGDYEAAIVQIQHLLGHKSYQVRGRQMMVALYDRVNLPSWTFPIYEDLIHQNPDNYSIWLGYASQRSKAGHWQKALSAYARVLENDPENIYALRDVHYILRGKRPAFHAKFLQFSGSDDTVRYHHHYTWRYTLTEALTFRTLFENIDIQIPENIEIMSQDIQQTTMEFSLAMSSKMQFIGRLFYYSGPGGGVSVYGALSYRLLSDVDFQMSYLGPSSWFDSNQALDNDGSYEEYRVSLTTQLFENLRMNSSLAHRKYSLGQIDDYGDRQGIHFDVSSRLLYKPDTTLTLSLDQGSFTYSTDSIVVPMVLEENTYSLSTYIQDQPFGRFYYFLSAGYRWDSRRSLSGFFYNPGLGLNFTSQFQIDFSYSYSSESTGVVQGSTQTYQLNGMIIF